MMKCLSILSVLAETNQTKKNQSCQFVDRTDTLITSAITYYLYYYSSELISSSLYVGVAFVIPPSLSPHCSPVAPHGQVPVMCSRLIVSCVDK